jgi:hypothetical protein
LSLRTILIWLRAFRSERWSSAWVELRDDRMREICEALEAAVDCQDRRKNGDESEPRYDERTNEDESDERGVGAQDTDT